MQQVSVNSPAGIKRLNQQLDQNEIIRAPFHHPKIGGLRVYEVEKAELVGQKIIGTKKRGVEPGFEARKIWTGKDTEKMLNDKAHKFHKEAVKFLREKYPEVKIDQLKEDKKILEVVTKHLVTIFPKFSKPHYWKLHYAEPSIQKVRIDFAQSKGLVHWLVGTAASRRDKNLGALMEVLSNDIFNVIGFGGQKLSLRFTTYDDGHPMFLLDGTHVTGPNGEKFQTIRDSNALLQDADGQGEGRIKDNMLPVPGTEKLVPINERQLGSALLKSLLMGDRDKVGQNGDNLGYVVIKGVAELMNIDPGKSFEEGSWNNVDRMSVQGDIRSDCTFDSIVGMSDKLFTGGYKNFSIFSDTTLADRMHGMRDIIKQWDLVVALFVEYIAFFEKKESILDPKDRRNGDISICEYLKQQQARLVSRKEMFEKVLEDRLKLTDDDDLIVLDNLEKLTSPTTKTADVLMDDGKTRQTIELKYLRIKDPKINRVEWKCIRMGDKYSFSFNSQDKKILEIWQSFRLFIIKYGPYSEIADKKIPAVLPLVINPEPKELLNVFSQQNIIRFKSATAFTLCSEPTHLALRVRQASSEAADHCEKGKELMFKGKYKETKEEFVVALGIDISNQASLTYLRARPLSQMQPISPAVGLPQKNGEALYQIARMYAEGKGVPRSSKTALDWYLKAAEQGHPQAQFLVGQNYYLHVVGGQKTGIEWFKKAGEQGHVGAQMQLAVTYYNGVFVLKSNLDALYWYEKAAEQGNADAQDMVGHLYRYGEGIEHSVEKSFAAYKKAAEQGHPKAVRAIESFHNL